jgi:Flp pilus assembly protein TadD
MQRLLGLFLALVLLLGLFGSDPILALSLDRTSRSPEQSDQIFPDYLERSKIIRNYEELVRQAPNSFLRLRLLAAQYLRRFRETADVEDLLRAEHAAARSRTLQPQHNVSASMLLASALLSQHRFQEALQIATEAQHSAPEDVSLKMLNASILMELGQYDATEKLLPPLESLSTAGQSAIVARYLELTGHLTAARKQMDAAIQEMDNFYTNSAETVAWFHVRAGDLAFFAGELAQAEQRYREALAVFPNAAAAFTGLTRLYAVQHRWQNVLETANQGIDRIPLIETLGYKADAQQALGNSDGAISTEAIIEVVARLSKVQGIYDRALAVYYSEHRVHLAEALEIARREVQIRDDIYAEDTLAWAAAANGAWQEAQQAAQQATRYETEDALLHFHRGMIELQCGNREEAVQRLKQALRLNAQFHPKYADEARQTLAELSVSGIDAS